MKLYLAGPMSGIANHNYPAFHAAAKTLRAYRHEVISPAELHPDAANIEGESTSDDYKQYLARDFAAIAECEALALLEGWEKSRGAVLEVHFARILDLPCFEHTIGYYNGISYAIPTNVITDVIASGIRDLNPYLRDVLRERRRQNEQWGEQNHDDFYWLAVLGEEFGEAAQALLHTGTGERNAGKTREEVIHVTAVGLQWLECMDRRESLSKSQF